MHIQTKTSIKSNFQTFWVQLVLVLAVLFTFQLMSSAPARAAPGDPCTSTNDCAGYSEDGCVIEWCFARLCTKDNVRDGNPCRNFANACDGDLCDGKGNCVDYPDLGNGEPCYDKLACNGWDYCLEGKCDDHSGEDPCPDGVVDQCNTNCVESPEIKPPFTCGQFPLVGKECEGDGVTLCTLNVCSEPEGEDASECINMPIEDCCEDDGDCADGNECTTDSCDLETGDCINTDIDDCGGDDGLGQVPLPDEPQIIKGGPKALGECSLNLLGTVPTSGSLVHWGWGLIVAGLYFQRRRRK